MKKSVIFIRGGGVNNFLVTLVCFISCVYKYFSYKSKPHGSVPIRGDMLSPQSYKVSIRLTWYWPVRDVQLNFGDHGGVCAVLGVLLSFRRYPCPSGEVNAVLEAFFNELHPGHARISFSNRIDTALQLPAGTNGGLWNKPHLTSHYNYTHFYN